jgi:CRISP-associated protein Cas1
MGFRTVVINSRCKLEYSLNYLVCRDEDEKRICVDEISTLIIQNIGVSMTAALLSRLLEAKVKLIICDPQNNPQGELVGYYDHYSTYDKIKLQMGWPDDLKDDLWRLIVVEKIRNQAQNLSFLKNENSQLLNDYAKEVVPGDLSNREGHAAKVYFASCFGKDFTRDQQIPINAYLNYGYAIVLSAINREVAGFGYLTQFGIHHIGETNPFNLSCDLIEPLRPYVDYFAISGKLTQENFKTILAGILSTKVVFSGADMFLENAIHLYVESVLLALKSNDVKKVGFITYELA